MSADSVAATSDELPAVLPVVHSHSAAAGTEISTCLHTYPGAKRYTEGRGSPTTRWMYVKLDRRKQSGAEGYS